jgi:hypothetical protein
MFLWDVLPVDNGSRVGMIGGAVDEFGAARDAARDLGGIRVLAAEVRREVP